MPWEVASLELLQGEVEAGHGHAGHAPQLLLHAQDGGSVDVQELCMHRNALKSQLLTARAENLRHDAL